MNPDPHPTPGWRRTHKRVWHYVTYEAIVVMRQGHAVTTWGRRVACGRDAGQTVDPQPHPTHGDPVCPRCMVERSLACPECRKATTEYIMVNHGKVPV